MCKFEKMRFLYEMKISGKAVNVVLSRNESLSETGTTFMETLFIGRNLSVYKSALLDVLHNLSIFFLSPFTYVCNVCSKCSFLLLVFSK